MGRELQCRVDFGKQSCIGKVLLETSEVLFRGGGLRLTIPFQHIRSMSAGGGKLTVRFADQANGENSAIFYLGEQAEKWEARIRNPPGRLDKLGVKPGMKVRLIGPQDDDFRRELLQREAVVTRSGPKLVFLTVRKKDDLIELAHLTDGRVWVVYPKGIEAVRESDVRAAGLAAGLVDIKVCAFSPTHTALKFTPRAKQAQPAPKKRAR
jgi:hypothetical protein